MIKLKTPQDIELMREGGAILASIIDQVAAMVAPGVETAVLNERAEQLILAAGARSSFKNYKPTWASTPYPAVLCVSINNEVVHGLPIPSRKLKAGDIVGLDCGLEYKGRYTDHATTVAVGQISKQAMKLMTVTQDALDLGIAAIKPGAKISDIARVIQRHAEGAGFGVVRQLVGHGVGFSIHEAPSVPNFVDRHEREVELRPGMTIAIEPMITMGAWPVATLPDEWTIVTEDGSISAHFEHTVAVTETGYEILTLLK